MSNAVKIFNHFDTPKKEGVYHRLICLTGENKGKAYFIVGKRIVIGRSETADVTILDLKSSREHAEIILVGDTYIITDLGSQNGIIVNDLKIKQHSLGNGDKIIIGKTVYKFSKVVVKNQLKKVKENSSIDSDSESLSEEKEPESKRLMLMLVGVSIILVLILAIDDEEPINKKSLVKTNISTIVRDEKFKNALTTKSILSEKSKEKVALYIQRGLRELREDNYFRAIAELESARQWSPNNSRVNAYLRIARERLDEKIEGFFNKALRDKEAINYQNSITSYCAVVRLLANFPDDSRYLTAIEGVKDLEVRMGLAEGTTKCIDLRGPNVN